MSTWIKTENEPDDVDLETIEANRNTIKVNDVEDGQGSGANKTAIRAINTNNGMGARALHTEGQVEFVAGLTGNPGIMTVKVYNPSTNDLARALAVTGRGDIAVHLANDQDYADKLALNVRGNTHLESYTEENAAHKTLEVVNGSTHVDARALKVDGKTELIGDAGIDGKLAVEGNVELSDYGCLKINDVNDVHEDWKALYTANSSAHADARALQALGMSEIVARSGGEPASTGLKVTNAHATEGSLAIHVSEGKSKFEGQVEIPDLFDDVTALSVTNTHNDGKALNVNGKSQFRGEITGISDDVLTRIIINDIDANLAAIETTNSGNDANARALKASGMVEVIGNSAGNPDSIGLLAKNSSGDPNARALKVEGKAEFDSTLQVDGDTELDGTLAVGPANAEGMIDSGGVVPAAEQDLKIGSGTATADVLISKDGQRTDILGDARLNGNEFVVNDAENITDTDPVNPENGGAGWKFDANGGDPRVNIYINGTIVAYFDSTGGH